MNEFLKNFIMKTIFKMIDNVPEWQIRKYAIGWYEKNVLREEDLKEIDEIYTKIEAEEEINETENIEEEEEITETENIEEEE